MMHTGTFVCHKPTASLMGLYPLACLTPVLGSWMLLPMHPCFASIYASANCSGAAAGRPTSVGTLTPSAHAPPFWASRIAPTSIHNWATPRAIQGGADRFRTRITNNATEIGTSHQDFVVSQARRQAQHNRSAAVVSASVRGPHRRVRCQPELRKTHHARLTRRKYS
ncbi:hypothetical protein PHLGIDRAFT_345856 [Phlebiopsis gigantea 11061_1 CR5-6]|uniref:Uncharacterized protein n=1 Tax=Phlebiopsis gigantea (strain 11061_1 CR5-6) TaxID=745531 RepID=A0A0C3SAB6_PHLG1|nr:hypothetical protein PHLGIDRAFT_345856 [Phlebiopsis gigantea 11061_1 CR5-6]